MKTNVTEKEIMAIAEPQWTKTWHPISHGKVISALKKATKDEGIEIISKQYSTADKGNNMFGTWVINQGTDKIEMMLGFRNSISAKLAIGICAGSRVIVCSNLMFSGEFIEFRRHTSNFNYEELIEIAKRSVKKIIPQMQDLTTWQNDLKNINIKNDFKTLTFDAMKMGVFAPSKFHKFIECYKKELVVNKSEETLYDFHGGITRLMRNKNLFYINHHSSILKELVNNYIASLN